MVISTSNANMRHIVSQVGSYIHVYNDGTIERPESFPKIPPSLEDPATGVSSKDILFSKNPYLSARLFLPKLTPSSDDNTNHKISVLVYFHGGGFCSESAFSCHHHKYCNAVASGASVMIVSIEHRKAPEHFLPAAYDDCWAGFCWVASHAGGGIDPVDSDPWLVDHADFNRIFIGGDSSGANLTHNIAMRAGVEPLPGGVTLCGAFINQPYFWGSKPIGNEPITGFEDVRQSLLWKFVYPCAPGGLDNPMINPLAPGAPSLATIGCSKLLIATASKDPFRDRAVLYYEAVKKSGWKGEVQLLKRKGKVMPITCMILKLSKLGDLLKSWFNFFVNKTTAVWYTLVFHLTKAS